MNDDDIDRILSAQDEILPSSGFAASVMEAVRRDAATPPPIPFPWARAWPVVAAGALALAGIPWVVIEAIRQSARSPGFGAISPDRVEPYLRAATDAGAHWLALAAALTLISVLASRRLAGRSV